MFNPELLIELIKKAQGDRTLNQFAQHCSIDPGNLSRIINNKNKQAPKPDTLKKIAAHAYNDVSYEELMGAAGHIATADIVESKESILSKKDEKDIEKRIESLTEELMKNQDGYMLSGNPVSPDAIESIIEALSFGIRQAKIINKKYTPKKYKK